MTEDDKIGTGNTTFWVGDDAADSFYHLGVNFLTKSHGTPQTTESLTKLSLDLIDVNDFDAYTTFGNGASTIHFTRGWIVRVFEALIGASLNEDWPPILVSRDAETRARRRFNNETAISGQTNYLSSIDFAAVAFRFVYLHEFYHASLGHTEFLSRHFGTDAFTPNVSSPASGAVRARELDQTQEIRTAFELDADACALKQLLYELFTDNFADLFARKGIGALTIGLVIELLYLMTIQMTDPSLMMDLAAPFRFKDTGVYPHPLKRRFYLITKLFESCETLELAKAFETSLEYGASVARKCYHPVSPRSRHTSNTRPSSHVPTQTILDINRLMKTGEAMLDPFDWVKHYDSILMRLRPELAKIGAEKPYAVRFSLIQGRTREQ